ncbi:MAG: acetoacetate decarboxylase family protein [Pyrodictiaceae archaeon]
MGEEVMNDVFQQLSTWSRGCNIPLHAPLYACPPWFYYDMFTIMALVSLEPTSIEPLLPEGVEPVIDGDGCSPGLFWMSYNPHTSFGPFSEALIAVQVGLKDRQEYMYYIPYAYVDGSDSSLASGREVLGLPKKFARIEITEEGRVCQGFVKRGDLILNLNVSKERPADESLIRSLLSPKTSILGLRVLPPIAGKGVAQLVKWYIKPALPRLEGGMLKVWGGPALVRTGLTAEDPVGLLKIRKVIRGFCGLVNIELGIEGVVREWRIS